MINFPGAIDHNRYTSPRPAPPASAKTRAINPILSAATDGTPVAKVMGLVQRATGRSKINESTERRIIGASRLESR